eukprot:2758859-Amphidinium_carterae.1
MLPDGFGLLRCACQQSAVGCRVALHWFARNANSRQQRVSDLPTPKAWEQSGHPQLLIPRFLETANTFPNNKTQMYTYYIHHGFFKPGQIYNLHIAKKHNEDEQPIPVPCDQIRLQISTCKWTTTVAVLSDHNERTPPKYE